ncbi:MAG: hypothetical protein HYR60_07210 [Acidobacteria bacterium]|nr:hypothetical protein [Acidobacteriota bacterium]
MVRAASAPDTLLDRAGKRVEQFWEQFSAVSCLEAVSQTKLSPDVKVVARKQAAFDYLILMQLSGDELTIEESRLPQGKPQGKPRGKPPNDSDRALLSTSGFATLILILHPLFQPSYEFSPPVADNLVGAGLQRVHFQHVRGRRSPSILQLKGREYPIEWQGDAWIYPLSGQVFRIAVTLQSPMEDVGLRKLASDVRYAPVQLKGMLGAAWLPDQALIEAGTARQHWKNLHTFSRFRQFSVDTEVKTEAPRQ